MGTTFTSGNLTYKITKASGNEFTVQVVKADKKIKSSVTIPATVTYKKQSFKVTSIAKNAFKKNSKLKKVVIGKNVTSIGKQAFYGCKNLIKVTFKSGKVEQIGSKAFTKTNKKITFKVGKKNVKKYTEKLKKKVPATAEIK